MQKIILLRKNWHHWVDLFNAYLDLAEDRAKRKIPMTMEDWAKRLDEFLKFDEREILKNAGRMSTEAARTYAESEFEKYRVIQDRLFESDFDKTLKELEAKINVKGK